MDFDQSIFKPNSEAFFIDYQTLETQKYIPTPIRRKEKTHHSPTSIHAKKRIVGEKQIQVDDQSIKLKMISKDPLVDAVVAEASDQVFSTSPMSSKIADSRVRCYTEAMFANAKELGVGKQQGDSITWTPSFDSEVKCPTDFDTLGNYICPSCDENNIGVVLFENKDRIPPVMNSSKSIVNSPIVSSRACDKHRHEQLQSLTVNTGMNENEMSLRLTNIKVDEGTVNLAIVHDTEKHRRRRKMLRCVLM